MPGLNEQEIALLRAELARVLAAPPPSLDTLAISQRVGQLIAQPFYKKPPRPQPQDK